jgi:eukaryotic-like serine/threonine-protein kinase
MAELPARLAAALADRYRIEGELGQGGMATVYLAQDLKHDRKVALKVLKPELAAVLGAERFVVEIKTTAALQHPHILPLFDSGTADGFLYYVMPYIEGETLRDKLSRETQLGIDEAVRITREVADALDYAHRHGVIHRDIKPENILLHDGRPMVADFGIALALSAAAGGRMTETGLSLGTPHYMSPEQATAEKELTARSDIYSLGCVLYEMLTGSPPHVGASAQQIVMRIVMDVARPVTELRKTVPPNVAAAVAKAVEKLPADRFESARAFADALANPAFRVEGLSPVGGKAVTGAGASSRRAFVGVAALAIIASAAAIWGWLDTPSPPVAATVRYQVLLFESSGGVGPWRDLALSPDGRSIVLAQNRGGERALWLKTPERAVAEPLAGTEGGEAATFSPDGQWIAFASGGNLRKVRRDGRDATTIANGVATVGATTAWLDDGTVLFTGPRFDLQAVGADGGPKRVVIPRDSLPNNVQDIAAVPGSRSALLVTCASNCVQAELWAVDLATGGRHRLAEGAVRVWHLSGGLAVFAETQSGRVLAAPYDGKSLSLEAPPTPVFEGAQRLGGEGINMALSDNGTLLFAPAADSRDFQASWITRDGSVTPVDSGWSFLPGSAATLSPDGQRLAVGVQEGGSTDIWLKELRPGGALTRLTFGVNAGRPEWTHDSKSLLYTESHAEPARWDVRLRRVDGTDSGRIILRSTRDVRSLALLRDTTRLIVRHGPPPTRDIYIARLGAGAADTLLPLLASAAVEEVAMSLSPDERWLAYASDQSGRFEVYVVPFPDVKAGRWQVSLDGGRSPRWARSGRELFFRDLRSGFFSVPVTIGSSPTFGERRLLFQSEGIRTDPMNVDMDVSPDDRRFLVLRAPRHENAPGPTVAVLVQNWLTEVRERLKGPR